MKLYVANIMNPQKTPNSVYIKGYTTKKNNGVYTNEYAEVRLNKNVYDSYIKSHKLTFPIVLDIVFIKGKGAIISDAIEK